MLKNDLICGGFLVSHELIGGFVVGWLMPASGQKQPLNSI
jgi:hypothetical protein